MNFLRRSNLKVQKLRPQVLLFYRDCLRVIQQLKPSHQKIWYDYTRLKFGENESVGDEKVVQKLLKDGYEELEWVKSVIRRRSDNGSGGGSGGGGGKQLK